ncbi:MAG: tRNA (adenosine(37)-N6)-dimethylallyltransferase MiaA [Pseudomonadota bacterium]
MTAATRWPVICLYGPTASGKTELALQCAEAFGCAIVSVDSALVYRGLDIGTAKPDAATLGRYPHALVNVVEPWERYSAADFCRDAGQAIREAHAAGRVPLLVGGTMLYFKALLEGLNVLPASDPAVRTALQRTLAEAGLAPLRAELARVDPELHARLSENDTQRTLRGLEVWRMTGRPLSAWQAEPSAPSLPLRALQLALWPEPRTTLHRHIESRFDAMLEQGFLDEVEQLRRNPRMHADLPSMRSVGYRQAWQYLDGAYDFDRFRAHAVAATRQLAKRQFTWLRSLPTAPRHNPYHAADGTHPFLQRIATWLEALRD